MQYDKTGPRAVRKDPFFSRLAVLVYKNLGSRVVVNISLIVPSLTGLQNNYCINVPSVVQCSAGGIFRMIRYWTPFNGRPNRANRGKERVTLGPRGTILLNLVAFETLGKPQAVEMLFDQTYGVIGMKPTRPDAHNAFPVVPTHGGYYRRVNAASFCRHFDIRLEKKTMLFLEPALDPTGVLELKLAKTITVTRGSR